MLKPDSELVVFGAGGHARSVIGAARDCGTRILGVLSDSLPAKALPSGVDFIGDSGQISTVLAEYPNAKWIIAIGDNYHRLRVQLSLCGQYSNLELGSMVHPTAVVSGDVHIGPGTVIMPGSIVMAGSVLGDGVLINTRSTVDHDCELRNGCSLAPGSILGGGVTIGERAFVGLGSHVRQNVALGEDCVVGMGSLVLEDVPAKVVAYGCPARVIRPRAVDEPYL